ncbi:hypothetical protein NDU88_005490 [Pleurodeles waltl]|uniref:Uncharacterized protein n=1 Tax=Pleurodeles waltl TaxID=8319 RepID=A0AAV7RL81_PLEWA|nr:hypothetical protein NDU88_005490 [Pleurodeles waltl]
MRAVDDCPQDRGRDLHHRIRTRCGPCLALKAYKVQMKSGESREGGIACGPGERGHGAVALGVTEQSGPGRGRCRTWLVPPPPLPVWVLPERGGDRRRGEG